MSGTENSSRTYFGWQREQTNFYMGFTMRRAIMIGAGVLLAVWPMLTAHIMASGIVAWPVAGLLIALAFLRIAGRTVDEWLMAAVSYEIGKFLGFHKFASGAFAPPARKDPAGPKPLDLPGILAPVTFLQAEYSPGVPLGISYHRHDHTYTAVARIGYPGIALVDSARNEQRVAGWGALLLSLCVEGSPMVRVQAMQRLLPESGAALRRWDADHADPNAPELSQRITSGMLNTASLATSQRESYLAFTLDAKRARSAIRGAGGGSIGAATVLVRHLRALSARIGGADLRVETWLSPRELAEVVRSSFDPDSGRHLAERRAGAREGQSGLAPGVEPALAGPAAAVAERGAYQHDGATSVTYVVYEWPRSKVYSTALAPLLGEGQHRRSFSLHVAPLGPRDAEKAAIHARNESEQAVELRQKMGRLVPSHEKAALRRAEAQDEERAAGHGLIQFCAYVTVTVTDVAELEDACASLEADAAAAQLEVRRLWFAQDIGFAMGALPLGFGLPRKRW